jgi:hypothetical protein
MNFYLRGNDAATGYPSLSRSIIEHTDSGPILRALLMLKSSTEPFKNCNP